MKIHDSLVGFSRVVLGSALAFYKNRLLARLAAQKNATDRACRATDAAQAALNLVHSQERVQLQRYDRLKEKTGAALKEVGF